MKQYTTPDQTDKLIELGFVPKARIKEVQAVHFRIEVAHDCSFTIGELIEMVGFHLSSIYYIGIEWAVNAEGIQRRRAELIDALYDMIIKLKEEGVIWER